MRIKIAIKIKIRSKKPPPKNVKCSRPGPLPHFRAILFRADSRIWRSRSVRL
jgi:hypothetical protein